jgi:hypothetical protein
MVYVHLFPELYLHISYSSTLLLALHCVLIKLKHKGKNLNSKLTNIRTSSIEQNSRSSVFKKYCTFFLEFQGFSILFTSNCQWFPSWARLILSTSSHILSLKLIIKLYFHLHLRLLTDFFPSDFTTNKLFVALQRHNLLW